MAKFLKNLKGLFIASDEDLIDAEKSRGESDSRSVKDVASESEQVPTGNLAGRQVVDQAWAGVSMNPVGEGKVDDQFLDILLKAMTSSNQEGYDYLEFKQALRSLAKMKMDTTTQYRSAYAMAQTMGANVDGLIASGQQYLKVLADEQKNFSSSVSHQRQSRVDALKQQILAEENSIVEMEAEIEKIKQEIQNKKSSAQEAEKELSEAARKIQIIENNFQASYDYLTEQITEDLSNMKKFLSEK